jgi:outer membrane murein-binding lipoprotein Lpp
MPKNNSFVKITWFCIMLIVIIVWGGLVSAPASSQQEQSRINALEIDINGIESRLNRIEAQFNQFRGGAPGTPSSLPPPSVNTGRNQTQVNREQMFERLATLVIELKQQVNKLEARVSKLESGGVPRNTR